MIPELPVLEKLKLNQHTGAPTESRIDRLDHLLVVVPHSAKSDRLPDFPGRDRAKRELRRLGRKRPRTIHTFIDNRRGTRLTLTFLKPDATAFERLNLGRRFAAELIRHRAASAGAMTAGLDHDTTARVLEAVAAAASAASFDLPRIRREPPESSSLTSLQLLGLEKRLDLKTTRAAAMGNNLARWLTHLPPNVLTPGQYRKYAEELAGCYGWQFDYIDEKKLKRRGAGAFLAVCQGSPERDAGIAHLRYSPDKPAKSKKPVSLVGKGICYDTGGTNLKPAGGMYGMHGDMQGSAVALGTLVALTELGVNYPVDCWLALSQNHIGSRAYKQNDVVTASDGTTIEIVHTDAEGRMVLADTLAIASKHKPGLMLDYATLTGSCVGALSNNYSGVMTNNDGLREKLVEAGRAAGERVWPFPMDADYAEPLKSDIADTKQCTVPSEADQILAAKFLQKFVGENIDWVHMDLSAGERKGGLAHVPTEVTGFGVRYTVEYLKGY